MTDKWLHIEYFTGLVHHLLTEAAMNPNNSRLVDGPDGFY